MEERRWGRFGEEEGDIVVDWGGGGLELVE